MGKFTYFRLMESTHEFKAYSEFCHQKGVERAEKLSDKDKTIIHKNEIDAMAKSEWLENRQEIEDLVDDCDLAENIWFKEWVAGFFSYILLK